MTDDLFVLIDIEATGLIPPEAKFDPLPIELGLMILDVDLDILDSKSWLIWDDGWSTRLQWMRDNPEFESNALVLKMHDESGLWSEAMKYGDRVDSVAELAGEFLQGHGITSALPIKERPPLTGSSCQYDRGVLGLWMPNVLNHFHYRNIDVSTIKELCRVVNPGVYEKLPEYTNKQEKHRVIPDLEDTREELGFYLDNFVIVGD